MEPQGNGRWHLSPWAGNCYQFCVSSVRATSREFGSATRKDVLRSPQYTHVYRDETGVLLIG
jgi:hypothetical protein